MSVHAEQFTGHLPAEFIHSSRHIGPGIIGGAALAVLAAGTVAGDELLTRRRPLRAEPYLEFLPAHNGPGNVLTWYEAGFNSHPHAPGMVYAHVAREFGSMIISHDPESGYDREKASDALRASCERLEPDTVVLPGDSGGGKKQVYNALVLHELGIRPLVVQFSTPNHVSHVKGWHRRSMLWALETADRFGFRGGDLLRRVLEGTGYKIDNPQKSLKECHAHVQRKFQNPEGMVTNPQAMGYARLIRSDISAELSQLGHDKIKFVSAADPAQDPVVDVEASHAYLEEHTGGPVAWIRHPELKHANTCERAGIVQGVIRGMYDELGAA